jgi:plastocyanin
MPMRWLCPLAAVALLSACGSNNNSPVVAPNPGSANPVGPQTWQLTAGASAANQAFQTLSYYPTAITIDAGDTLKWSFPAGELHTVTLLGPNSATPSPGDPANAMPAGGTSFDGSTFTNSGLLSGNQTYALAFSKPGTYHYFCLIHPGMQGTVAVQAAGAAYPTTQTAISSAVATQEANDLALGPQAVAAFPFTPGGPHVAVGISPGLDTGSSVATVMRFLDGDTVDTTSVTIPVGTSVTWTNLSSNATHTVTFGIANQPFPKITPPTGPASGGTTYDGTHIVNSGLIPPGASFTITFTAKGTFTYHCLLHDDSENMIGTVVVQ